MLELRWLELGVFVWSWQCVLWLVSKGNQKDTSLWVQFSLRPWCGELMYSVSMLNSKEPVGGSTRVSISFASGWAAWGASPNPRERFRWLIEPLCLNTRLSIKTHTQRCRNKKQSTGSTQRNTLLQVCKGYLHAPKAHAGWSWPCWIISSVVKFLQPVLCTGRACSA